MEELDVESLNEAEQYHLKAQFVLHELQANKQVYGSNSALTGATPADVDLALQYINRSLEHYPENAIYLNLKALLLWEGKGNKDEAAKLLEKAASLKPSDIDIQNNLKAIKTSGCFVATAAFGTPLAEEINILRQWRDGMLSKSFAGKLFILIYYAVSPSLAAYISNNNRRRAVVRSVLKPLVKYLQVRCVGK